MELQRNPFLINRALSKFLMASVFSAVAIQLAAMIDSTWQTSSGLMPCQPSAFACQ